MVITSNQPPATLQQTDLSGLETPDNDGRLSEGLIIEAARAMYDEKGRWPSQNSEDQVPGLPGETWRKIHAAGYYGFRGLEKGRTLAEILKPIKESHNSKIRRTGGLLTEELIQQAAITYYEEKGEWPSQASNEPVPGLPEETWRKIHDAGHKGHRGLTKGRTLAEILKPTKLSYGSKVLVKGVTLTEELVIEAARKHFEEKGEWPSVKTLGHVPGMPEETWPKIQAAGFYGLRGLKKGRTLAEILKPIKEFHGSKIRREKGSPLTEEIIVEAAMKYYEEHGMWPNQNCEDSVPGLPGETWGNIYGAGHKGTRGLAKGRTLAVILKPIKESYGFKVPVRGTLLTEELIVEAAIDHYEVRGTWPSSDTPGNLPGMPNETWRRINAAGYHGFRGLTKGRTLSKILEPVKRQFSISLGSHHLPNCFVDSSKEDSLRMRGESQTSAKYVGAQFTRIQNITFSKGEAFEQLVGILLLALHQEELVIPQYCLSVAAEHGYYGMRADFKAGDTIYEAKWGGATQNIEKTFQKHVTCLDKGLKYKLLLLDENPSVTVPYSTFEREVHGVPLAECLRDLRDHIYDIADGERGMELLELRNYLFGLVMKGNTFTGVERLAFLAHEIKGFLESPNRGEFAKSNRYAIYSPLAAYFEYQGTLYSGRITPRALQIESPEQYETIYCFGDLMFKDPTDRDIAVMYELSEEAARSKVEELLQQHKGLVQDPLFNLRDGRVISRLQIGNLEELKQYLTFSNDNFTFGLEYIAYFGSQA